LFLADEKVDNFGMLTCRAELGYYLIYYAMMFNGLKLSRKIFKVNKELMYRLITDPGNDALLLSCMVQVIED